MALNLVMWIDVVGGIERSSSQGQISRVLELSALIALQQHSPLPRRYYPLKTGLCLKKNPPLVGE